MYVETRVGHYSNGEKIYTALALPVNSNYYTKVPYKYIYATKNKVYQMTTTQNSLDIFELIPQIGKVSNIDKNLIKKYMIKSPKLTKEPVQILTTTRSDALDRAFEMFAYGWTYDPSQHFTTTTTYKQSPEQLVGVSTITNFGGIPYKWGGMNGKDTDNFSSYGNFNDELNSKTAGDIKSPPPGTPEWEKPLYVTSSTAGIDCSGFISAAYEFIFKLGTSTIPDYFTTTTWVALLPGDIANRVNRHVWMMKYRYVNQYDETYMYSS